MLFLELGKVFIDLFLSLFVVLELLEPVRLINKVLQLLEFGEFGYTVVEEPPKRGRLRASKFLILVIW